MPTFSREMMLNTLGEKYVDANLADFVLPNGYLEQIHEWIAKKKGLFFFSGNPGLGKTYFTSALCNWYNDKNLLFRKFSCNDFLADVRSKIKLGWDYIEYINGKYNEVPLFCLDDIGQNTTETEWQNEVISHLIDMRYTSQLPTVITSNKNFNEMRESYGERTISRLAEKGNLIIRINWKDKRQEDFR